MALSQIQLLYQITPIFLTGGIATNITGGILPLLSLTNTDAFSSNLLDGNEDFELDDAFAIFQPAVGGSLVEQVPATYPWANLSIAANAIIRNPINVSMLMAIPMRQQGAWSLKLSTMTALKNTLDSHNNAGGTYTVCTPAYTYTDMILVNITDCSIANSPIPQNAWRWDFTKPLVSLADLTGTLSNLMNQITSGVSPVGGGDPATTDPSTALTSDPNTINQGSGAGGTAPLVSSIPIGGGAGNVLEAPTGTIGGGGTPTEDPLGWSVTVSPNPPPSTGGNFRRRSSWMRRRV